MPRTNFVSIDEYISTFPKDVQEILEKIRFAIQKIVPHADEVISYQMPAFKLGKTFVYFAAFKKHIGIYPPVKHDKALLQKLTLFSNEKGNLKFSLSAPIPYELIAEVALALSKEIAWSHT